MKTVYQQDDGGFVVIENGTASVYDMRPGLVPPGEFRESRVPTVTDLAAVAAEEVVARVEPSTEDRLAALEQLIVVIANSSPGLIGSPELLAVQALSPVIETPPDVI